MVVRRCERGSCGSSRVWPVVGAGHSSGLSLSSVGVCGVRVDIVSQASFSLSRQQTRFGVLAYGFMVGTRHKTASHLDTNTHAHPRARARSTLAGCEVESRIAACLTDRPSLAICVSDSVCPDRPTRHPPRAARRDQNSIFRLGLTPSDRPSFAP